MLLILNQILLTRRIERGIASPMEAGYILRNLLQVNQQLLVEQTNKVLYFIVLKICNKKPFKKGQKKMVLRQILNNKLSFLKGSKGFVLSRKKLYTLDSTLVVLGIGVASAIALAYFVYQSRDPRISIVAPLVLTPIRKGLVLSGDGQYFRFTEAAFKVANQIRITRESGALGTDLQTSLDVLGGFFKERQNMMDLIPYFFTYANNTIPSSIMTNELAQLCANKTEIRKICQKIIRFIVDEAKTNL